jgi:hypothetical protein
MLQDGRMIRGRNGDMIWRVELTIISHYHIVRRSIKLKTIDSHYNGHFLPYPQATRTNLP